MLDRDVLPVDIAGLLQALEKRNGDVLVKLSGFDAEIPNFKQAGCAGRGRSMA